MPDSDVSIAAVHRQLGELTGLVKAMTRELERDREEAREGRARLYARVEQIDKDLALTSQIAVQARDKVAAVEKTVIDDVKPQTDKIRNMGLKGGGALAAIALVAGLGGGPAFAAVASFFEKITK